MSAAGGAPLGMMFCGACARQIPADAPRCELCGWINPHPAGQEAGYDGQCAYELDGVRCPLPGAFTPTTTGTAKLWYCRIHGGQRQHDAGAAHELEEIREDPHRFVRPQDWRDVLIAAITDQREGVHRQPGESRSAYVERMRNVQRELLREHARRMNARQEQQRPRAASTPAQGGHEGAEQTVAAPSPRPAPSTAAGAEAPGALADALPAAPPPQARVAPISLEETVEDAMDQVAELTAKLEEEGYPTETAQREAFEMVFRQRIAS